MLFLLRKRPVKTLKHLPQFLPTDMDFKNTALINDDEQELLRLKLLDIKNQCFVETTTWGLSDWERILNIPTNDKIDYKTRRSKILSRLSSTRIVTLDFMYFLVNLFVSDKTGQVIDHPENYAIEILLPDGKVTNFKALDENIQTFIPAHIGWKYIAYVNPTPCNIYIGSVMTSYFYTEIPADTTYEIGNIENVQCNSIGVIKRAEIINIPADYTK